MVLQFSSWWFISENDEPPKVAKLNKQTGMVEYEKDLIAHISTKKENSSRPFSEMPFTKLIQNFQIYTGCLKFKIF